MADLQAIARLAKKQAAKASEQQEAKPISERIDDSGKITIWHLYEQKYKKLWPVDATHLIATGQALLEKPIDEAEPEVEQEKAIEEMTVAQLNEYAEQKGIDISEVTLKADIIETIRETLDQE